MIYMHQFIPQATLAKLQHLPCWSRQQKGQLHQAYFILHDTVLEYLRRQLARGKWHEVQEILKGKPLTPSGKFLLKELQRLVTGKLMWYLDVKKVFAASIVLMLLPLILAKLTGEMVRKAKRL
ncbi:hypothetical protein [Pontibacter actiniarum]|uniref:Uncharacterized protein n=1 Tax=Pontibacter actiniarum TaxID=323450 RepID=A0A1X9YPY7_9BACT|nr:hypothetical protein [Pontibacter actiniarum]ARS34917.1 hypothetical protein CA264_05385 [Pontibacter actiniarum]